MIKFSDQLSRDDYYLTLATKCNILENSYGIKTNLKFNFRDK